MSIVSVPDDYAEGISVVNARLYQLSWTSGRARIYALPDLECVEVRRYDGEGWGLSSGPEGFYATNGSSWVRCLDESLRETHRFQVTANGIPIRWLNDLQCVGDLLLVNVVGRNELLEVDRLSGRVTRLIDCNALAAQVGSQPPSWVFNGVAYDPDSGHLVVTGKNWPYLFFLTLPAR